jgi:hypothetical protein
MSRDAPLHDLVSGEEGDIKKKCQPNDAAAAAAAQFFTTRGKRKKDSAEILRR